MCYFFNTLEDKFWYYDNYARYLLLNTRLKNVNQTHVSKLLI